LRLTKFDKYFSAYYREHSFLNNPLVPDNIKRSISRDALFINTSDSISKVGKLLDTNNGSYDVLVPSDKHTATLAEVRQWMALRNDTVVRFHSLYGSPVIWTTDSKLGLKLKRWFDVGFECCEYEQWNEDLMNLAKMWPEKT
jgi:hypothetical protein